MYGEDFFYIGLVDNSVPSNCNWSALFRTYSVWRYIDPPLKFQDNPTSLILKYYISLVRYLFLRETKESFLQSISRASIYIAGVPQGWISWLGGGGREELVTVLLTWPSCRKKGGGGAERWKNTRELAPTEIGLAAAGMSGHGGGSLRISRCCYLTVYPETHTHQNWNWSDKLSLYWKAI